MVNFKIKIIVISTCILLLNNQFGILERVQILLQDQDLCRRRAKYLLSLYNNVSCLQSVTSLIQKEKYVYFRLGHKIFQLPNFWCRLKSTKIKNIYIFFVVEWKTYSCCGPISHNCWAQPNPAEDIIYLLLQSLKCHQKN